MVFDRVTRLYSGKSGVFFLVSLICLTLTAQAKNVNGVEINNNPSWYTPPNNWEYEKKDSPSIDSQSSSESPSVNEEVNNTHFWF